MTLRETFRRLLPCLAMLGIAACAGTGPPVQEMSDARQAISAAREAGAETLAGESLGVAETRLAEAEVQLQGHMYWTARRLALSAKESAIAALLHSRSVRDAGAVPATVPPAR